MILQSACQAEKIAGSEMKNAYRQQSKLTVSILV
jgi:hypothetical protein